MPLHDRIDRLYHCYWMVDFEVKYYTGFTLNAVGNQNNDNINGYKIDIEP